MKAFANSHCTHMLFVFITQGLKEIYITNKEASLTAVVSVLEIKGILESDMQL